MLPCLPVVVALALTTAVAAQGCVGTGQTFWQRDSLPVTPTGLGSIGVIAGMCEGESAGVVFTLPPAMSAQRLTRVVAPWGHAPNGTPGFQAALDIEVYDGVSFSGATANMGTLVFRLSTATASNMQVATHGLNTFDMTPYGVVVGLAPTRRFAVCFRCDLNAFPGTCAQGYDANFFTDAVPQFGLTCDPTSTPQQTSLLEIAGQGWRDAALATVPGPLGPVQLCPIYYRGVFCIRACSEDAFPAFYTTIAPGCPNSLGTSALLCSQLPRLGQTMIVNVTNVPAMLGLMITGASASASTLGPLPVDLTPFGMPGCHLRVALDLTDALITFGPTASWSLAIPNQNALLGQRFFQQAFVFDPPLNAFGGATSAAAQWQIGN